VSSDAALAAVNSRLDDIAAALRLMIATQHTHTEMLAKIFGAACPSEEGGELEDAMRRVAGALRDQTTVLERVEAELSGLGAEVEAGVMRGLSQALGVDGPADEDGDAASEVGERGREGEGRGSLKDGGAAAPAC
jgi:uncharacterized protein (DUF697 family)